MDLDKSFRRIVFVQVLLGVVAFCIAERNPGLMLIAGSLAVLSRYLTEGPLSWQMPRWLLNVLALATVGWLVADLGWQRGNVIVAMGHFMMWLQILLLYAPRSNRDYGQILVLSLMLMIGASILSVSMVYGVLLAVYCGLGLWTVLRFQLKAAVDQVIAANQRAAPPGAMIPTPKPVIGRGYRWHLRIMAVCIGLVCATIAVAVFVVMPRRGDSYLPAEMTNPMAQTQAGFNDQVNLAVAGPTGEGAQEPVLNMRITLQNRNEGSDTRTWLLRGAALDHYEPRTHTWRRVDAETTDVRLNFDNSAQRLADPSASSGIDYQAQITLRQPGHRQLFTIHPVTHVASDSLSRIRFSPLDQQMSTYEPIAGAILYTIRWPMLVPQDLEAGYRTMLQRVTSKPPVVASSQYARTWSVQRDRIAALAQRIIETIGLSRDPTLRHTSDDRKITYTLADYLRQNFSYSLDNPAPRASEEPVIEFLFNHQTGHCELFASALAAMCRSINIPARVVTGYRVSEYNRIGGYYVVRQSNAHAWCEVNFGPKIGWRTVDATPPDDVEAEHRVAGGWLRGAREIYDYLEFRWIGTVVAYDPQTRTQVIEGLGQTVRDVLQSKQSWIGRAIVMMQDLPKIWRLDRLNYTIAGIILVLIGLAVGSLVRTLVIRQRRLAALHLTTLPRSRRRGLSRKLRFYLQMLDLLERHGHRRPQWQCPYHFAQNLVGIDSQRFAPVLQLTEVFYEIRFGHRDPDAAGLERIGNNLRRLEQALR
jgi:transglutaminase-like putative cysteine protease